MCIFRRFLSLAGCAFPRRTVGTRGKGPQARTTRRSINALFVIDLHPQEIPSTRCGGRLGETQFRLGHESISTTRLYVKRKDLKNPRPTRSNIDLSSTPRLHFSENDCCAVVPSFQIAPDIAVGLGEIPEITHRHFKPDNILFCPNVMSVRNTFTRIMTVGFGIRWFSIVPVGRRKEAGALYGVAYPCAVADALRQWP